MGRFEWYRSFRKGMLKSKMFFTGNVRVGGGPWTKSSTEEIFELATTGFFPSQLKVLNLELVKLDGVNDKKQLVSLLGRLKSFKAPKISCSIKPVNDTDKAIATKA